MTDFANDEMLKVAIAKKQFLQQACKPLQVDSKEHKTLSERIKLLDGIITLRQLFLIIEENDALGAAREIMLHDRNVSEADKKLAIDGTTDVTVLSLLRHSTPGVSYQNPYHSQEFGFAMAASQFIHYHHYNKVTKEHEVYPNAVSGLIEQLRCGNYATETEIFARFEYLLMDGLKGRRSRKVVQDIRTQLLNYIDTEEKLFDRGVLPAETDTLSVLLIEANRTKELRVLIEDSLKTFDQNPGRLEKGNVFAAKYKVNVTAYVESMAPSLKVDTQEGEALFDFIKLQIAELAKVVKLLGNLFADYELAKIKRGEMVSSSKSRHFTDLSDNFGAWTKGLESSPVASIVRSDIIPFLVERAEREDGEFQAVFQGTAQKLNALYPKTKLVAAPKVVVPVVPETKPKPAYDAKAAAGLDQKAAAKPVTFKPPMGATAVAAASQKPQAAAASDAKSAGPKVAAAAVVTPKAEADKASAKALKTGSTFAQRGAAAPAVAQGKEPDSREASRYCRSCF